MGPPDDAQLRREGLVETLVGGTARAAEIRRVLAGTPDKAGVPQFSIGARAGYFLRHFPDCAPPSSRAREIYRYIADLSHMDAAGHPQPVSIPHKTLAKYAHCAERSVSAAVRVLARTGRLPLIGVTPGKPGRASRFVFVCDPFAWAAAQEVEADRVRGVRQSAVARKQAQTFRAAQSGTMTDAEAEQHARNLQRQREWNLPPRGGRLARFRSRLANA
jgi:hypothetical protein